MEHWNPRHVAATVTWGVRGEDTCGGVTARWPMSDSSSPSSTNGTRLRALIWITKRAFSRAVGARSVRRVGGWWSVDSSCRVVVTVSRRRMRGEAGAARNRSGAGAAAGPNGNGSYPPISAAYWLPPSNPMPYHVPGDTLYCPHMTSHVD